MGQVFSFTEEFFERFAKEFVDVYEQDGPLAAATFSVNKQLPRDQYAEAREYITAEFIKRGYTFPNNEQELIG